MNNGNGQLAVPPGFRFHPTDEELVYYYLRKKVAYEAIDLDVIRDVDLNKLEPWDLNDKCRIGSGPQNEWYFFSHKDKKYPTGTRTNRATTAGFWKATGRDKAIHVSNSKRIGMRKTLVFYTGRAPHGLKTDWIMHEYRLLTPHHDQLLHQEEGGWVVCRVFKKKKVEKCSIPSEIIVPHHNIFRTSAGSSISFPQPQIHGYSNNIITHQNPPVLDFSSFDNPASTINMHHQLPQLLSADQAPSSLPNFCIPQSSVNPVDLECSHNLMKLTSINTICGSGGGGSGEAAGTFPAEKMAGDWSILDQFCHGKWSNTASTPQQFMETTTGSSAQQRLIFPLQYLGCEADLLKFCKEG